MSTPEIYRELESSAWNEINPAKCPCRNGWLLSDFDTWHQCRTHGKGVPHPEDDSESAEAFDWEDHRLKIMRTAYATFRHIARRNGFKGDFELACLRTMANDRTPLAWVNAAEDLAEDLRYEAEEKAAIASGYSCGLEARLASYAAEERWERDYGHA